MQAVESVNKNESTQHVAPQSTASLVLDTDSLEKMIKLAEFMAKSKAAIPDHFKGNPGDCLALVMQAMQWKMNPYTIASKTHVINGVLGYEAQLVNAVIISIGPIEGRLEYEWFGDWSKVTGKFKVLKNGEGKEYRIPAWSLTDEEGLGVIVRGTIKGESQPRERRLLLAQARVRNSTMWADDPEQQLAYLCLKKWARLYMPDVILGVYTPDELESIQSDDERDVTARSEVVIDEYSQEEFEKNLPAWEKAIKAKKANAEFIRTKVSTKATMTDEQFETLKSFEPAVKDEQKNEEATDGNA